MSEAEKKGVLNAAANAIESILNRKRKARMVENDSRLRLNTRGAEVIKGSMRSAGGWVHGPANLSLNKAGDKRLAQVSAADGEPVTQVRFVRAAQEKGTKKVYLFPTDSEDPDKIEIQRYSDGAWINLIDLLAPEKLTIQTNYKEFFAVYFAKPEDPVYPALVFDMDKSLERKPSKRKKSEAVNAATPPVEGQSENAGGETPKS